MAAIPPTKLCPLNQYSICLLKFILEENLKMQKFRWNLYYSSLSIFTVVQTIALLVGGLWFQDMTVPHKIIWIIDILGPKWPKVFEANWQPGFWLAIVVNNSSLFHALDVGIVLITQAKHVPRGINWMNMTFKCNQCGR